MLSRYKRAKLLVRYYHLTAEIAAIPLRIEILLMRLDYKYKAFRNGNVTR